MKTVRRGYHGWNILAICVLAQIAALGVATNCLTFFLHSWSRDFNMPISQIVMAIPIFSVTCCFLAPVVGALADRYPVRLLLAGAMLVVVIGHLLIGFAVAGWQIIAIYALLLPFAASFSGGIPTQTLVSRWFVRRRGLAFSICAVGLVLAGILFPPVVVYLIEQVGWRATWLIFGVGILLFVLPATLLVIRERPGEEEGRDYIVAEATVAETAAPAVRDILTRRNFWVTIAVFAPVLLSNSAMQMNFAPFAAARGLSVEQAAILIGVFNAAAAGGKLATGTMTDRFGNRLPLLLLSVLGAASTFWLVWAQGFALLSIGFVALGLSQGVWVLLASCMAAEFGSSGFPRAYGIASCFAVLTTISPPVLAWLAETTGGYSLGLLALGAICLIAVFSAPFFIDHAHAKPIPLGAAVLQSELAPDGVEERLVN
jgi:MFS family permease